MNLVTIPVRNLGRKKLRTLLMVIVFAIGVSAVSALYYLSESVGKSLEEKMTAFGANILITPKVDKLPVSYGGLSLGDVAYDMKYLDQILTVSLIKRIELSERISAIAPKYAVMAKINDTSIGVIGVDWTQELRIKNYWSVNGDIPYGPNQALVGSTAARELGVMPGSMLDIHGAQVFVSGILESTGAQDDNVLFMGLSDLQKLYGHQDRVHFIEVAALCSGCPIDEITVQLAQALPNADVKALQQVVRQRMMTVSFVKNMALGVSLIILLTACVMIGLSIFAAVNERKSEIGVLRALGYSKWSVFAVFCLEAVLIALVAGPIGYVSGFFAGREIISLMDMSQAGPGFDFPHLAASLGLVMVLAVAASAIPSWRAAKVDPSQALVSL